MAQTHTHTYRHIYINIRYTISVSLICFDLRELLKHEFVNVPTQLKRCTRICQPFSYFRKVLVSIQPFTVTRNRITRVYRTCDDYIIDDPQVLCTQEKKPY